MRVAVIGDVMLDIAATVVERENFEGARYCFTGHDWRYYPGGAANVAAIIAAAGVDVKTYGAIAQDWAGIILCEKTNGFGTLHRCLRNTIIKFRAYCDGDIRFRVDRENTEYNNWTKTFPYPLELPGCDAIVFSDYCKGMFRPGCEQMVRELIDSGTPTVVDPHVNGGGREGLWRGATIATPNLREHEQLGCIGAEWTAVTLGAGGCDAFCGEAWVGHYGTEAVHEGAQVVGAGDAFTAAVAMEVADHGDVPRAIHNATLFATEYVGRERGAKTARGPSAI